MLLKGSAVVLLNGSVVVLLPFITLAVDLVVDFGFLFRVTPRVVFTVLPFFVVETRCLMAVIIFPVVEVVDTVLLVGPAFLVVDNRESGPLSAAERATI